MWRPKGWKCPYDFTITTNGVSYQEAYETGADHMLQAMCRWIRSHEETTMLPDERDEYDYFPVPTRELEKLESES